MKPRVAGDQGLGAWSGGSLPLALVFLGLTVVLVAALELALFPLSSGGSAWPIDIFPVGGLVYTGAGLLAWWRRPSNRMGPIMVFGGWAWFIAALVGAASDALDAVGTVLATLILAIVIHLVLAFPSGRLRSRLDRWTVASAYFTALVLQVPLYLFDPEASPQGMLAVSNHPDLTLAGEWLQAAVGLVLWGTSAVILTHRFKQSTPRQRRVLGPLYVYGIGAVLWVPLAKDLIEPLWGVSADVIVLLQGAVLIGVPVSFTAGMLLGGFARTGELQELAAWLGTGVTARSSLTEALAHALGDASLDLAYWVPERGIYVDGSGASVRLPIDGSGRGVVEIGLGSHPVAAVTYDATLIGDPELVRTAGRVVAVALDHERLTAELLASRDALRRSRARLVEAGDRERRRIAQNLHDGLQVKLVLLAVEAQRLGSRPGATAGVTEAAATLRSRIDSAAGELRELVHAVMPAPLIERGLGAAVQDLVDRLPVLARADLDVNGSLPKTVSSAAYFVVSEALGNAVKHAHANLVTVRLTQQDAVLAIEVSDDGIGGVQAGGGLGLRSLADRVDVLGGCLRVHSPSGEGTRIEAELPCES
jgi:signal transduction histidine kinase